MAGQIRKNGNLSLKIYKFESVRSTSTHQFWGRLIIFAVQKKIANFEVPEGLLPLIIGAFSRFCSSKNTHFAIHTPF